MTPSPVTPYLPHRGRMLLLDSIIEVEPARIVCDVTIRSDSAFCMDDQVPGYVGIEYMAQAIGTLVGWQACQAGGEVKTGFLVSARRYDCAWPTFPVATRLFVEARENWRDDSGLGLMDCTLCTDARTEPVATATLTVFQPPDLAAYLASCRIETQSPKAFAA